MRATHGLCHCCNSVRWVYRKQAWCSIVWIKSSRNCVASIANEVRAGRSGVCIPAEATEFTTFLKRPYQLWYPQPHPIIHWVPGFFPKDQVPEAWRRSLKSSTEVTNDRSYTSTPSIHFRCMDRDKFIQRRKLRIEDLRTLYCTQDMAGVSVFWSAL